jgi:hypothetical protein
MPQGGKVGRAISRSQGAFVTPIVTNNPVFQVKLVDVDDKFEQPAGQQKPMKDEIRRGEAVVGMALGNDNKKKHKGLISNIIKDAKGNVTSFVITDEDGDQIKLDPTSVARLDLHDDGKEKHAGEDFQVTEQNNRAKDFNTWLSESNRINEELLNPGNLPDVPERLVDMIESNGHVMNRIIVHLEGGELDGWYDYNRGFYSDFEWEPMEYTKNKAEQKRIVFDQDVIDDSEKEKTCKEWKKWLVGMSKKKGYAFKVKEVYLGET